MFRNFYLAILLAVVAAATMLAAEAPSLTVEQLVAQHRAAVGSPEALKAVQSRVAEGTARFEIVTGGAGTGEGKATLLSQGHNLREVWRLAATDYRGEDLLSTGEKLQVYRGFTSARTRPEPQRSLLGGFLFNQSSLLNDGLFGGALSTAWPLLDEKVRGAKLSYEGLKKVDGVPMHEVRYKAKKSGDIDVRLYFDPETFRHVMTVATMSITPQLVGGGTELEGNFMGRDQFPIGGPETANARQQTIRYRLVQRFSGFQQVDGLTLPSECRINFSAEGFVGQEVSYVLKYENIQNNVSLDPKNFQVK